jgi:hypothetical protein
VNKKCKLIVSVSRQKFTTGNKLEGKLSTKGKGSHDSSSDESSHQTFMAGNKIRGKSRAVLSSDSSSDEYSPEKSLSSGGLPCQI